MKECNSLHYFYDVSYQCWFASEEAKIYCNNFNSSNAVVCSHLTLAYTVWLAIINAVELERNGWVFFYLINVVLWLKRTSTKSLQIELVTKYVTKDAQKESLVGESKSAKGGPYPLADLDRGGPNPRMVQIHCDTGSPGRKRRSFGPITLVCRDYQANNWEDRALWFISDDINYFKSVFLGPSDTKNSSFVIL